ncbi:Dicer-like protein 2 [Myotisia sp. PD_48]|nr:Dicer-like protein 2 [Myotisia sp. PD_48]
MEHIRKKSRLSSPVPDNRMDSNGPPKKALRRVYQPRAYQEEMFKQSLRQNTIVVMGTGSGKTLIAILRIQEELRTCPSNKLVWFLAPTVPLVEQQYQLISEQLPAFQARKITGADNVDYWSKQKVWDNVLLNIRVVVSTPQVLLDALSNGFIKLSRISLLIFDEAHHCVGSSPQNRIMKNFYHPQLATGQMKDLPSILGLTASPTTGKSESDLRKLAANLNSVCKTPRTNRDEMARFVNMPEMRIVPYQLGEEPDSSIQFSECLTKISNNEDPDIEHLYQKDNPESQQKLLDSFLLDRKPCVKQLRRCTNNADRIKTHLGSWASEVFLLEVYQSLLKRAKSVNINWSREEGDDSIFMCKFLGTFLHPLPLESKWDTTPTKLSQKAELLVEILSTEFKGSSRGIIFVEQRTLAVLLCHLITMHPALKHISAAYFLGSASYGRRDFGEIGDPKTQKTSLKDFSSGKKNLLVATSVLEEGIDVPECDYVICFDAPKQLRSFIQTRGRARKKGSNFIKFQGAHDPSSLEEWEAMEKEMKEKCMAAKDDLPDGVDIAKGASYEEIRIQSTGYVELAGPPFIPRSVSAHIPFLSRALLTLDNARQHLSHFCSTVSSEFTSNEPEFVISDKNITNQVTAKVVLPGFLDPNLREFHGVASWGTEKMAMRDAAYQAYAGLYEAGLVNDHLMPAHSSEEAVEHIEKSPGYTNAAKVIDPLHFYWQKWTPGLFFQSRVEISSSTERLPSLLMVLPVPLPGEFGFHLFWNKHTTFTVSVKPEPNTFPGELLVHAAEATSTMLSSLYSEKMISGSFDFSYFFMPDIPLSAESLRQWCSDVTGRLPGRDINKYKKRNQGEFGLARHIRNTTRPWVTENLVWIAETDSPSVPEGHESKILHIEGQSWPKRKDFLHPVSNGNTGDLHHSARKCHPANDCTVDKLPAAYSRLALFMPSLIHMVEIRLIARVLRETILAPVEFQNMDLILTAIIATSALETSNYQRLEFLGDSVLKFHTSTQLAAQNRYWHEGLLTAKKFAIVSNNRLTQAALATGLDKFILTDAFTGAKWAPSYRNQVEKDHAIESLKKLKEEGVLPPPEPPQRELPTKTLADVVEALIGAAEVDSGTEGSLKCLEVFLPEVKWIPYDKKLEILYNDFPKFREQASRDVLLKMEALIGYKFKKKELLAAAFTHSSNPTGISYQRLEFIGDSVLDLLVSRVLFRHPKKLTHFEMHLLRTTLVNKDFLGFLCMNLRSSEPRNEIKTCPRTGKVETTTSMRDIYLWQYMAHGKGSAIVNAQQSTSQRWEELRTDIDTALRSGKVFPWTLLASLDAEKFYSDIIESILGAIFIDSQGSLDKCCQFLERIGLDDYLTRVMRDDIDIHHPKARLGRLTHRPPDYITAMNTKDHSTKWTCQVMFRGEELARIDDGLSRREAEAKAAEAAILRMKN